MFGPEAKQVFKHHECPINLCCALLPWLWREPTNITWVDLNVISEMLSIVSDILRQSERLSRDFYLNEFLTYDRQSTCIGGLWWDKVYDTCLWQVSVATILVASLSALACMFVLYCVIRPLPCRVFVSSDSCTCRRKQTAIRHFMQYCHCEVRYLLLSFVCGILLALQSS